MKAYEVIKATRGSALTPTQRLLLIHVSFRAGADGECWAAASTLATDVGVDERTVRRALAALVELGVVARVRRPGQSDVYRVAATPDTMPGGSGHGVTPDTGSAGPRTQDPDPTEPRTQDPGHPGHSARTPRTQCPDTPDTMSDDSIPDPIPDPIQLLSELLDLQRRQGEPPNSKDEAALDRQLRAGSTPDGLRYLWTQSIGTVRVRRWSVLLGPSWRGLRVQLAARFGERLALRGQGPPTDSDLPDLSRWAHDDASPRGPSDPSRLEGRLVERPPDRAPEPMARSPDGVIERLRARAHGLQEGG